MYIHLLDHVDDNIRMIAVPTSAGEKSTVYTYTVSGLESPRAITFDGTHIHLGDNGDDNVRMILPPAANGQAAVVYAYTVSGLENIEAAAFDGTHLHLVDVSDDNVRMILPPSLSGQAAVVYTYRVIGLNNPQAAAFDGTHLHLADGSDDNVRMILPPSADGQAAVVYTYRVIGLNNPRGATFDGTYIHLTDLSDDNVRMILPPSSNGVVPVVYTYRVSGANDVLGLAFDGDINPVSDATLTISTSDADIRAGESVSINIASDIDITGFSAEDITVTGGTKGSLVSTDAQNYVLTVTAGSAGTLTVSIAEDVVSPGNASVSQSFTVSESSESGDSHAADAAVYFVDGLLKETDTSLLDIIEKTTDLANLRNIISIPYITQNGATETHTLADSASVADEGEQRLYLETGILESPDPNWLSLLAESYLDTFKDLHFVLRVKVPIAPEIELGELYVLKTDNAAIIDYEKYEVMRVTHDFRRFETTLLLRNL